MSYNYISIRMAERQENPMIISAGVCVCVYKTWNFLQGW